MEKFSSLSSMLKLISYLIKLVHLPTNVVRHLPSLVNEIFTQLIMCALKLRNFEFLSEMISQGAMIHPALIVKEMTKDDTLKDSAIMAYLISIPEGRIQLFHKALLYGDFKMAEALLMKGTWKTNTEKIDMNFVIKLQMPAISEKRQEYITFVKMLIKYGIYIGGMCPLDVILDKLEDYQKDKIQLLSLLMQRGVTITNERNQTTLLHIATKYAVDSGNYCL